jgi:uncharacterized lipoprotein YajG
MATFTRDGLRERRVIGALSLLVHKHAGVISMRRVCLYVFAMTTIGLSACAYVPQKAEIKPEMQVYSSDVGQGKSVIVLVTDERDTPDLGHRGGAIGTAATISSDQDLTQVFKQAVFDGLKSKGFAPTDNNTSGGRQLKIEIRSLNYSTSTGFWTGGVDTKGAIKAIVTNSGTSYEKVYRASNEERVVFVPTAKHNADLLNKVVNDILTQLFADQSLLANLVKT